MRARSCSSTLGRHTSTPRLRESSTSVWLQNEQDGEASLHALRATNGRQQLGEIVHEDHGCIGVRDRTCDGMHFLPQGKEHPSGSARDDFIIEGAECDLKWVEATLWKKYVVKMRAMLGPERTDDKVADNLNRVVEWKEMHRTARGEDVERHGAAGM